LRNNVDEYVQGKSPRKSPPKMLIFKGVLYQHIYMCTLAADHQLRVGYLEPCGQKSKAQLGNDGLATMQQRCLGIGRGFKFGQRQGYIHRRYIGGKKNRIDINQNPRGSFFCFSKRLCFILGEPRPHLSPIAAALSSNMLQHKACAR
jgi:hypothetical protein